MNVPTNMQLQSGRPLSCAYAAQSGNVFDIEDFGNFSSYRRNPESIQTPRQIDYGDHYYDSGQYSRDRVDEPEIYNNYEHSPIYDDSQNCPFNYMVEDFSDTRISNMLPFTPNNSLARLPCKTDNHWDYNRCFSYYANGCYNTCRFVDGVDIEDFM